MTRPVGMPDSNDLPDRNDREAYEKLAGFFNERGKGRDLAEMAKTRGLLKFFPEFAGFANSMLRSPQLSFHYNVLSLLVRKVGDYDNSYSHFDREWVQQVIMWEMDYCTSQIIHLPDALYQGVRIEAIKALAESDDNALTEDERLKADFARQVLRGALTDETWNAVEERIGPRGAVELAFFVTYAMSSFRLVQAITGGIGPSRTDVLAEVEAYSNGSRPMPVDQAVHLIEDPQSLIAREVSEKTMSTPLASQPDYR